MTEDQLQKAVATYLDACGLLWCHVPNEGKRHPVSGKRLKDKGMKAGVPDCLIFESTQEYKGLAIELKVGRNTPTASQLEWKAKLISLVCKQKSAYDIDQVISIVKQYYNK